MDSHETRSPMPRAIDSKSMGSDGVARRAGANADAKPIDAPLRAIEELICQKNGAPLDLLRCNDASASTTLGVFLKGRLIERVVQGSCGWGHLHEGDLVRTVNGVEVDAYSVLPHIRKARDAIGTAVSIAVERKGQTHNVVLLRQRLDSVTRAESIVNLLIAHGEFIQDLGELEERRGDSPAKSISKQLQKSFEAIQVQFGDMQHEACQAEHNLATHLAFLQEQTLKKLGQARKVLDATAKKAVNNEDIDSYKMKSDRLNDTVVQLENALSQSRIELYKLNDELAACRSDLSAKTAWAQDLELQLKRKSDELETSQAICQESDQAVRELGNIQMQAVEELERKQRSELEIVRQRLKSLEMEVTESRARKDELEQEQATMFEMCKEVEQKNIGLRQANVELEGKLARGQQEYAELQSLYQDAAKYKDLEQDFYDLQKDAEERVQALERSMEKSEIESQKQLAGIHEKHAEEMNKIHEKHSAEMNEMVDNNQKLCQAIAAGERALTDCSNRLQEMTALHHASQKSVEKLEENIAKFEESTNNTQTLDADLQGMRDQLNDAGALRQKLEDDLSAADDERQNLQKLLSDARKEKEEIEQKRKKLQEQAITAGKEKEQVEQKKWTLEHQCTERDKEIQTLRELNKQQSTARSEELERRTSAEEERKKMEAELKRVRERAYTLEQQQNDALLQLEKSEKKCKQKNDEIQQYRKSLYHAEAAAADSDAELANCRARLIQEGKEMESMMEEVSELQKAVLMQTSQHANMNYELLSAKARIEELESAQVSLRPLRLDNSFGRVLGWLHLNGRTDADLDESDRTDAKNISFGDN